MCTWDCQSRTSGAFLYCSPPCYYLFLIQTFLLNLKIAKLTWLLVRKLLLSLCFRILLLEASTSVQDFCVGAEDLNSGLPVLTSSLLPIEPSVQLHIFTMLYWNELNAHKHQHLRGSKNPSLEPAKRHCPFWIVDSRFLSFTTVKQEMYTLLNYQRYKNLLLWP